MYKLMCAVNYLSLNPDAMIETAKRGLQTKIIVGGSFVSVGVLLAIFFIATKAIKKTIGAVIIAAVLILGFTYLKMQGVL